MRLTDEERARLVEARELAEETAMECRGATRDDAVTLCERAWLRCTAIQAQIELVLEGGH